MSVCPMLRVDILNEKVNAVVKATVTEVVKLQPLPAAEAEREKQLGKRRELLEVCISSKTSRLSSCLRGFSGSQTPWMESAPYGNDTHGFSFYYFLFVIIILTD